MAIPLYLVAKSFNFVALGAEGFVLGFFLSPLEALPIIVISNAYIVAREILDKFWTLYSMESTLQVTERMFQEILGLDLYANDVIIRRELMTLFSTPGVYELLVVFLFIILPLIYSCISYILIQPKIRRLLGALKA